MENSQTSIENTTDENKDFVIYPNPVKSNFYIKGTAVQEVNIFSLTGSLIKKAPVTSNSVNVSDLLPGTYLIRIKTDNGFVNKQIVKE
ncbi:MAG: T9SS type A sorting domain-containing protein [Bacteroidales bacterium]|nr:T9SS type A sorting domain-containing protein [Bacteroidales bacterium]